MENKTLLATIIDQLSKDYHATLKEWESMTDEDDRAEAFQTFGKCTGIAYTLNYLINLYHAM